MGVMQRGIQNHGYGQKTATRNPYSSTEGVPLKELKTYEIIAKTYCFDFHILFEGLNRIMGITEEDLREIFVDFAPIRLLGGLREEQLPSILKVLEDSNLIYEVRKEMAV